MSVLRYNVVSDKRPYRPREEHLRNFFANVRRGSQPVDNSTEATLMTERATNDQSVTIRKPKTGVKTSTRKRPQKDKDKGKDKTKDSVKTTKKSKAEDKINGHKFT
jgi:hypothetical protein